MLLPADESVPGEELTQSRLLPFQPARSPLLLSLPSLSTLPSPPDFISHQVPAPALIGCGRAADERGVDALRTLTCDDLNGAEKSHASAEEDEGRSRPWRPLLPLRFDRRDRRRGWYGCAADPPTPEASSVCVRGRGNEKDRRVRGDRPAAAAAEAVGSGGAMALCDVVLKPVLVDALLRVVTVAPDGKIS